MKLIAKDLHSTWHFIINETTWRIELSSSHEHCEDYIRSMVFHKFYYIMDKHGHYVDNPLTNHYFEIFDTFHDEDDNYETHVPCWYYSQDLKSPYDERII